MNLVLSPSEMELLGSVLRSEFDQEGVGVFRAEQLVKLTEKLPLKKDLKKEMRSDFESAKNDLPLF